MLQTQIRIGKQISQGRGHWEDILDRPVVETETKKGESITNYVLTLVFNLDDQRIEVDAANLSEYDPDDSPERFFNLRTQVGNNKAIYTCVRAKKLDQLRKTLFGVATNKSKRDPTKGEFAEAIENSFPDLKSTLLYEVLNEVFKLRSDFENRLANEDKKKTEDGEQTLTKELKLRPTDRIILIAALVVWVKKGVNLPITLNKISGYHEFILRKFPAKDKVSTVLGDQRLCYATGEQDNGVGLFERTIRSAATITDMFVTETKNYSSSLGMDDSSFAKSYQVAAITQLYLERGAKYLLENYRTQIAGIDHCIIPQVFSRDVINDVEITLARLKHQSELLFDFRSYQDLVLDLGEEVTAPYWITFLGFDTDGKSLKAVSVIKDVSRTHFELLIEGFRQTHLLFKNMPGVNWQEVMWRGEKYGVLDFNLYTVYRLIPVRDKKKAKQNEALNLFRQVLEKRPIERHKLFGHFKELILCHRFKRSDGYANIDQNTVFDFAIRNAVFQYLAFIHVLNQFNLLIPMEEEQIDNIEESELDAAPEEQVLPEYQQHIEDFFAKMDYKPEHKALFYLGRVLNSVARAQYESNHKNKPVLNKLNYNGMDRSAILRLHLDLAEKTNQYKIHKYTEPNLSRFATVFNSLNWTMKPDEALFFILCGYSFYVKTAKNDPKNN